MTDVDDVETGNGRPAEPSALLEIDSRREGPSHLLVITGELDIGCADDLERMLVAVEDTDAEQIVLDLSRLGFIDSSGLRVVLAAAERNPTGRLKVAPGDGAVRRTLSITGVETLLDLVD